MSSAIVMPKVGLTMTEGKIMEWKKRVGDRVELGEIVFVFETEKVSFDVEATQAGIISKIVVDEGETVPIGADVAYMDGGEAAAAPGSPDVSAVPATPMAAPAAAPAIMRAEAKPRATPLARRIVKVNGIDLAEVAAYANVASVKKRDVEAFLAARAAKSAVPPAAAPPAPAGQDRLVKLTSMREIIARKMIASTTQAAQAYMVVSVDAGNLGVARRRLAPGIEKKTGVKPTITDLLTKLVAEAIGAHPIVNTRWTDEGILWLDAIHIGIATALDDGLVVPVIADAGTKTLSEIAVARNDLISRARAGKLEPERMRGGTFSISSLGMFGVEEFSAVINQPESAILAVGAIADSPVVRDGAVVVRPMMKLTLTYDHRIIDGAKAAAFLATLKDVVEYPFIALA